MTTNNLKVYLIAGEPSGDLLASRLMRAMRKKLDNKVEFFGVGGDTMQAEGLKSLFDISDLAVMGLVEVIPNIPKVLRHIKEVVEDIKQKKPDVVITVDSWSFSARIHKALRRQKIKVPQIHYVAPQVWAWKKKRAKTMYKYIDCLLTLLEREPQYFTPYHLPSYFVGHPVIESNVLTASGADFRKKYHIPDEKRIIVLLPGSRHNEISRLLPIFAETAAKLLAEDKNFYFVVPTVGTVASSVKEMMKNSKLPHLIIENEQDRYMAFRAAEAAIAASGTVALELAIVNVPHIIAYKVSPFTGWLAKHLLHIQFVNLSNIILGREVVPELLQERCDASNIEHYILSLLSKGDLYEKQQSGFAKIKQILSAGDQTPSENACDVILQQIKEYSGKEK